MTRTVVIGAFLLAAFAVQADDDTIRFKVSAGGKDLLQIAVPRSMGDGNAANEVANVSALDLPMSGYFKLIDEKAFLANLAAEGLTIRAQDWKNVGAQAVIKARASTFGNEVKLEFKLYEIAKGDNPVLQKEYKGATSKVRFMTHQWCAEVVKYFTGEDSFFNSRMLFASAGGKMRRDIYAMDWDGAGVQRLTQSSQNLLPAWAPNGGEIAFTSYLGGGAGLYTMPAGGGKPRAISTRPGLNIGAAYSPDGSKIAATLSQDGNSEIYLLSRDGAILKRLTNNPFIDTSPSWSPDGSRIAFVSDRLGSPQIWVMNADGSNQRRLTTRGNYNQTPSWCPRTDTPLIAFTARDEKFAYDIFTIHADTGDLTRITEGRGSNQRPTWAPNGRAIAYESSRGGIWISTADGRTEKQVYKGGAATPAWGPALK
jgi:TolB protein